MNRTTTDTDVQAFEKWSQNCSEADLVNMML